MLTFYCISRNIRVNNYKDVSVHIYIYINIAKQFTEIEGEGGGDGVTEQGGRNLMN